MSVTPSFFKKARTRWLLPTPRFPFNVARNGASGQLLAYSSSTYQSILFASGVPICDYSVSVTVMDASWQQSDQAFDKLKQKALELGFTAIGVTDPDVSEHVPFLEAWIDAGFQGTIHPP